ncbi:MAG: TolC family protein [Syntrophomonadaceae bacterium]|nr:TolC family protein [Syntrophomonadaceae bacterium]
MPILALSLLLITLLVSPLGAAPGGDMEPLKLTLQESIDRALRNNPEVTLAQLARDKAKVGLSQARDAARAIDEQHAFNYELGKVKWVYPKQAQNAADLADQAYQYSIDGLKLLVEKSYYDLLKAQRTLDNKNEALKRAEEMLRVANSKYSVGTVPRTEVLNAEVRLAQAQAELTLAGSSLDTAMLNFNQTVGIPLGQKVTLVEDFGFVPFDELDINQFVEESLQKQIPVLQARSAWEVKQVQLETAGKYYSTSVYSYKLAEIEANEAEQNYVKTQNSIRLAIMQNYSSLLGARDRIRVLEKSLEQARENVRLANLRYEVGLGTNLEVLEAAGALNDTQAAYLEALYNYNLCKARFKYQIFTS